MTALTAAGAFFIGVIQGLTQARLLTFVLTWVGLNLAFWAFAMVTGMPVLFLGLWLSERVRPASWIAFVVGLVWILGVRFVGAVWILMQFADLNAVIATLIVGAILCVEFTSRTVGRGPRFRPNRGVIFSYELRDRDGRSLTSSDTYGTASLVYSNAYDSEFDSSIARTLEGRRRGFKTVIRDISPEMLPLMGEVLGPLELSLCVEGVTSIARETP